jgi:hypothetical protein
MHYMSAPRPLSEHLAAEDARSEREPLERLKAAFKHFDTVIDMLHPPRNQDDPRAGEEWRKNLSGPPAWRRALADPWLMAHPNIVGERRSIPLPKVPEEADLPTIDAAKAQMGRLWDWLQARLALCDAMEQPQQPPDDDRKAEWQPPAFVPFTGSATETAVLLGESPPAVDAELRRFADRVPGVRFDVPDSRKGEPRILYRTSMVWQHLLDHFGKGNG